MIAWFVAKYREYWKALWDRIERDPRRCFSYHQREALHTLAGGNCQKCGGPLGAHWHADHVVPWISGGRTTLQNGQALCVSCNCRKGYR